MAEQEKKVKLDELPDERSEPGLNNQPKISSRPAEPRIKKIQFLSSSERMKAMSQSWSFDSKEFSFNWFPFVVAIVIAEISGYFQGLKKDISSLGLNPDTLGADTILPFLEIGAEVIAHPLIFLVLFPIFFKLRVSSQYEFCIKFDGIETQRRFLPWGSKENLTRVFVQWDAIVDIKKVKVNNKEILQLFSPTGHIADLIWYIDKTQKRALKLLLSGMIHPMHPLRVFLDKEKEIM